MKEVKCKVKGGNEEGKGVKEGRRTVVCRRRRRVIFH
jgi:hypothetical protein